MTTAKSRAFGLLARTASAFLVGGVVGWCYEQLIGYMTYGHVDPGHGGIGIPFLTIYAAGAAVFELVLGGTEWNARNAAKVLSACAVISGVTEYATGRVMLDAFGAQTWDYRAPGWDWGFVTPDGLLCMRALLTFAGMGIAPDLRRRRHVRPLTEAMGAFRRCHDRRSARRPRMGRVRDADRKGAMALEKPRET